MDREPTKFWSGLPVYQCRHCDFEWVDANPVTSWQVLDAHEANAHPTPPAAVPSTAGLVDASGLPAMVPAPAETAPPQQ